MIGFWVVVWKMSLLANTRVSTCSLFQVPQSMSTAAVASRELVGPGPWWSWHRPPVNLAASLQHAAHLCHSH